MREQEYEREKAVQYAKKWAYGRNPEYFNFDPIGGDCTNFISQCIFAGSKTMNYKSNGWYYKNGNDKSPSWTGVEFLYNFLTQNKGVGPYGEENKEIIFFHKTLKVQGVIGQLDELFELLFQNISS